MRNTPLESYSRSPHGERGLKSKNYESYALRKGRSPHGERGLKCGKIVKFVVRSGRSPHGERGLKSVEMGRCRIDGLCRSPHGERGLKW